jgi:putative tricarboxylic transport membrane protein
MSRDGVLGLLGLVLAAGYAWMAARLPESLLADAVGPQGLPRAYAIVLAALSLVLLLRAIASRQSAVEPTSAPTGAHSVRRAAGLLALGGLYLLVVPWAGYVVSIAALIAATTWYQGGRFSPRIALVAAGGAAVFWLLFVVLLGVPHPSGLWPDLL